ncbi:exodeoxyribonuclease III [bacterium]|nr:exodeoxyribonuclease III [bacterium]
MTSMRILSWNVNGIRAIQKKGFLEWLQQDSPDILCIQETKAQPDQLPANLLDISGYHAAFASAERKGYSGVANYSRIKPKSIRTGLGEPACDSEGRTLIAEYDHFTLFNIYYPNGKASAERLRYKMDFYDNFLKVADSYRDKGHRLIICGDVNTAHRPIDLARPKENETVSGFLPGERAWIDKFLSRGYLDTLRLFTDEAGLYTWWDYKTRARERNVGWRIDYFFISGDLKPNIRAAFILNNVTGSDHCPIGIDMEF